MKDMIKPVIVVLVALAVWELFLRDQVSALLKPKTA